MFHTHLGYNFSALYIHKTLAPLSDYYDITWQPFTAVYSNYNTTLSVTGTDRNAGRMTFSPSGHVEAPIVAISNNGCDAADFPENVSGNIALISRGGCEYGLKSALAGAAKAAGVVIYNNQGGDERLWGTLIERSRPEGPYPPTVGISQNAGRTILTSMASRERIGNLTVEGRVEDRVTMNLIAQTKAGDQNNVLVLGAHADSVEAGPGIQDNGSGVSCLLEVALQLAKYNVTNAVRFAWWSAEEFGLAGSQYYVDQSSAADLDRIRLYINFDMIASPNYILGIYDGDASDSPEGIAAGPAGSGEAELLFTKYLEDVGQMSTPIYFNNRSDYQAFIYSGIPSTGPFTGAEGTKTAADAAAYGGTVGQAYDPNYHKVGDTVDNLNMEAFLINTKAAAHAPWSRKLILMQPGVRSTTTGTMASEKINAGQSVFLVVYSANTRGMVGNIRMINLDKVKKLCTCPVKTEI
ncbi:putative aminopeptidase y [Diaporthe ampelina]|uniref:Peptide hydrolase n=1 Tax=Diaporthe ampelina TaxID=1214573 RepID=A0A0G2HYK0_9PEZI|nr:putative aminopeptidase y [Diaporthe ampelina]